jgi:hypothetical protein
MEYMILARTQGKRAIPENYVSIKKSEIIFTSGFERTFRKDIKRHVLFAADEDDMLCFKFCEKDRYSYLVTRTNASVLVVRTPRPILSLNPKFGSYEPERREDGWFATKCKLNVKR